MPRPKGIPAWNKLDPQEKARRNKERCLAYYARNKERQRQKMKEWNAKNREVIKSKNAAEYLKNKATHKIKAAEYRKKNRAKIVARQVAWAINKRKTDIGFRILKNVMERIRFGVRNLGHVKHARTLQLLGCSIEYLRGFLEGKFEIGMTWENYGKWEIDHIIPVAAFDLKTEEAQKECFHYSNLQPLWSEQNNSKSDIMPNGTRARFNKTEVAP